MATDLSNVDIAQLRTLRAVFRRNSFSAAAEELGVTQSTVSYAVGRLREAFGDPLFVRQGPRIAPTERCRDIVTAVSRVLEELDTAARPAEFDPATAKASVTMSCNAYERLILIPPLVQRLRRDAPGLNLRIITAFTNGNRHLLDGEADLVVSPIDATESGIYSERLMSEHYVCLMDRDNPLAAAPMTQARYLAAPHLVVHYGGAWRSPYLRALEASGHTLRQTVSTPSPADLPNLLKGTDLIATAPSRLRTHFGDGVRVLDCPFPAPFDIYVQWAARSASSPVVRWLRSALHDLAPDPIG